VLFLMTGVLMWFDHVVPRLVVAVSYVIHDIAALIMLGGFIVHIYEGTAQQPGTFQAMTNGTVSREWAWTHHPAWYAEVTGRNPREDYEQARRRIREQARAMDVQERSLSAHEKEAEDESPLPPVP
jgi:cytochrome b subunit of formate dehydrogenase